MSVVMKKLTDQQLKNYEFLSGVIISGEIPYDDPDGYPYLMIDNTEWTKSDLEQRVEEALSKGELENPEYLDDVVVFIKKHIESLGYKVSDF